MSIQWKLLSGSALRPVAFSIDIEMWPWLCLALKGDVLNCSEAKWKTPGWVVKALFGMNQGSWSSVTWFFLWIGLCKALQLKFSLQLLCSLYKGFWNNLLDLQIHWKGCGKHSHRWTSVIYRFTHLFAISANIYWMAPRLDHLLGAWRRTDLSRKPRGMQEKGPQHQHLDSGLRPSWEALFLVPLPYLSSIPLKYRIPS